MLKNQSILHENERGAGTHGRENDDKRSTLMEKTIEELIYEETEQRLKEMAAPGYQWPGKADKKDAIAIAAGIGASLLLIILCMTGVIV